VSKREFKSLIVDDESNSRDVLKVLLQKFCPVVKVIGEAENVDEAYKKIVDLKPEVVFLDIQMPGGNGFSLLKRFTEIPFQVIFITSYDKYAIEAIRFSALYYLMKPIEVAHLVEAVEKLEAKESQQKQLLNLMYNEEASGVEKRIAVHNNDTVVFLPLNVVVYLEGEDTYTAIQTVQEKKFVSSKNLGKFEEILEAFPQFLRISKSCIVNLNHVSYYSKGEPCFITLSSKYSFEISRRKKQEFLERMQK
jgi:two-component system LytT family response regulator